MKHKIVVVDDEILIQGILAEELSDSGYLVELASSGEEVLKILQRTAVDLIISDIQMPHMTGIQLLRKVQESFPKPPPLILVSAFSDTVREEAYAAGAQGVFAKPIEFEELTAAVARRLLSIPDQFRSSSELSQGGLAIEESFLSRKAALIDHKFALGRGGFFISLAGPFPRVDSEMTFALHFEEENGSIEGRGIVRWIRRDRASAYQAGIGVEILSLSARSIECFLRWREGCPLAFIPLDGV